MHEIRRLAAASGLTYVAIARLYGITASYAARVAKGLDRSTVLEVAS